MVIRNSTVYTMRSLVIFIVGLAAVSASDLQGPDRIVGGSLTTIDRYPDLVALLFAPNGIFFRWCGGVILNHRSILTAAHCIYLRNDLSTWRIRVGSTYGNSGGVVFNIQQLIVHEEYHSPTIDHDIGIMRVVGTIANSNIIRPAIIGTYMVQDNQVAWLAGWGGLWEGGPSSEQLRHVQVWIVNQYVCRQRYSIFVNRPITDNMLCSGFLDVGGRDACQGDSGGPLYHNGAVIGLTSWGNGCARPYFPGVNTRLSRYGAWIKQNA